MVLQRLHFFIYDLSELEFFFFRSGTYQLFFYYVVFNWFFCRGCSWMEKLVLIFHLYSLGYANDMIYWLFSSFLGTYFDWYVTIQISSSAHLPLTDWNMVIFPIYASFSLPRRGRTLSFLCTFYDIDSSWSIQKIFCFWIGRQWSWSYHSGWVENHLILQLFVLCTSSVFSIGRLFLDPTFQTHLYSVFSS